MSEDIYIRHCSSRSLSLYIYMRCIILKRGSKRKRMKKRMKRLYIDEANREKGEAAYLFESSMFPTRI